ncbi:MAG: spirocyclase AveC family protein, partial [Acidimicrobiia bacterium]
MATLAMETEPGLDPGTPPPRQPTLVGVAWGLGGMAVLALVVAVAHNMRAPGVLADRVRNPDVTGAPRPVEPLFGDPHWLAKLQWGTVAMVTIVVVVGVVAWRRHPRHPILLCAIACTGIVWLDPVMNWAPYAVYN